MKKQIFISICLIAVCWLPIGAQKIDISLLKGLAPRNVGPAGMSGRVTAIDVVLTDPDIIYVGTASGGVWKSTGGGILWHPIFDDQPIQSIGALAINQKNPSEIWVGTGEGNPRNSHNSGAGIYKSIDGGKTWKLMGLKETKTIHRIYIHPENPEVIFVAAMGSIWGPNSERGVYKTTNAGKTWEKILYINEETGCADLVVDPSNPNKLVAAMWEYGRKPWTFNSGGSGSGLYITHDGGTTWEKRTSKNGLPEGNLGRLGLAIAPSKPEVMYALVEAKENALYKSTDGGNKWIKMPDKNVSNRPFYYHEIYVDPQNENRVFNLYSGFSRSEDGGKSFEEFLPDDVHPDHHAFWIHPKDPNYIIEGNDGGLNISRDGGSTWRFIGNLPVGQFYHINFDMDVPYNIGGGMQDNGSWVGPSSVWRSGGILNTDWQEVFFGDGFDVAFRPGNGRYVYAMSQGGNLGYIDRHTGNSRFVRPVHPDGDTQLRFNWNAAFAQNPFHDCGIYYGSQFLHKSMDCGASWQIISPDLTTNDPEKQKQAVTGGLTIDNTSAENHTTIIAIAPSPADEMVIWAGTDDGNLQLTRDGGKTWTNLLQKLPGVKTGSWIPYIEASAKNAGEAFVIVNDYRRNDWRPMAFHTTDFGQSFKKIVEEKQVDCYTLAITQDPVAPNLLWLGTDCGLYFTIDGGSNWTKWTNGYPSVQTADLKTHPRDHDLVIATFGRSLWVFDDITPIRELAISKRQVLEKDFKVFKAPDAYLAETKSYNGYHFPADAEYQARNKQSGGNITVWVKPDRVPQKEASDKAKKKRPERVLVKVLAANGDTIRNFSSRIDTGMNKIYWNLRRDGVRTPSRRERRGSDDLPVGLEAKPGSYKLVFIYGDWKDSTTIEVKPDPRIPVTQSVLNAREETYKQYSSYVAVAAQAFEKLQEAKKEIRLAEETMLYAPEESKKELAKLSKAVQDTIASIENRMVGPEVTKGIVRSSETLQSYLSAPVRYISDMESTNDQPVRIWLDKIRREVKAVVEAVNSFFEKDFEAYKQKVVSNQKSIFKPFQKINIE